MPLAIATLVASCGEGQKQASPPPPAVTVAEPVKRTVFDYDEYVGRFTAMVSEMSEAVQFLFVTHNKATMEAAQQLSGVTMREPGVSRLVSVDLAEATRLAGAA